MNVSEFDIYSRRGQEIVMVLYALRELGAIRTKEEVMDYIRRHRYYNIQPTDKHSYEGKHEWKADTLLCWGRKDAVLGEWMFNHDEKNSWELAREGMHALEEITARFRCGRWKITRCYMWTPEFKRKIDPNYQPSSLDLGRPVHGRTWSEGAMTLLEEIMSNSTLPREPLI